MPDKIFYHSLRLAVVVLVFCALDPNPAVSEDATPLLTGQSLSISGYFSTRSVFRTAETDSEIRSRDLDIYSELRLDMFTPKSGKYEFHFFGTARNDLDGNRDIKPYYPLEDIGNAGISNLTSYLYEAHLDINNPLYAITQLRIGRQAGTRDEQIFFDGFAMDIRPLRPVNLTVYGGVPVHFFEVNASQGHDALYGAGIDIYPGSLTGLSLDYLFVKDKRNYFENKDTENKLFSVKLWQRIYKNIKTTAKARFQDSEPRDMSIRVLSTFPDHGIEAAVSYFRQFKTQTEQSNELSPFYDVLGASYPFQSVDLKIRQIFGTRYIVDFGYFRRDLINSSNTGTFNREFNRASTAFEISDFMTRNLSLTIIGEFWKSDEKDFWTSGADIGYGIGKNAKDGKVSAGTYYSLYKYDYYLQPRERDEVRTYYLNIRARVITQLVLNAGYELERSLGRFQTLKLGVRYDF